MKIIYILWCLVAVGTLATTGCTKMEDPLTTEQYKKIIYLVGANKSANEGLQTVTLPYGASAGEELNTYISLAIGGSLQIGKEVSAVVSEAGSAAITQYNQLYLYKTTDIKYQAFNTSFYAIGDYKVTVPAGETYGRMPIRIKTYHLHCDSLYALTFKIASVSEPDYVSIRNTDTVLLFTCKMTNSYSGTYQETGRYYKSVAGPADTASLALSRTFKAVSYNTVRFYHLANSETVANLPAYGVTVKINDDKTLAVSSWGSGLTITDGGGSYDPATKKMDVWYNYLSGSVSYQFKGKFVRASD